MVDQGKEAGLRARDAHGGTASNRHTQRQDRSETSAGRASQSPSRGLSEHTRNRLATQLRTMYDTMAQQPVPDRFAELIAQLDSSEHGKS